MKRDTVINVLLIIAGIVLAIALFGAGVLWKSGAATSPKSLSSAPLSRRDLDQTPILRHTSHGGTKMGGAFLFSVTTWWKRGQRRCFGY